MIPFRLLPAVLAALVLIGCDSSTTGPLPEPEPARIEVLPLDIGRMWAMEFTHIQTFPGSDETTEVVRVDTFRVVGDTLIDGERWSRVTSTTGLGRICFAGLYTYREDGLYRWPVESEGAHLYAPYPETEEREVALFDSSRIAVPQAPSTVTVPFGTVDAYDFTKRWMEELYSFWGGSLPLAEPGAHARFLAPGLGPVLLESGFLGQPDEDGRYTITPNLVWRLVATTPGSGG